MNNLHKYDMIGDVRIAFKCFKNLPVMSDLTLKEFSLTLAMLLFDFGCAMNANHTFDQGFGREKDRNRADLCLHSTLFCFESGSL